MAAHTHIYGGYNLSICSDVVEATQTPQARDRWSRASIRGVRRSSHVATRPCGMGHPHYNPGHTRRCDVG
jgi:hypothetical protein